MRTIAVGANLGSVTASLMYVLSALRTFCCRFATLVRMTKTITIEASQWVWNEKIHLYLQVSDFDLFRKTWLVRSQEEGVGWNHLPSLFQRHPTNFYDILILELIIGFQRRHA